MPRPKSDAQQALKIQAYSKLLRKAVPPEGREALRQKLAQQGSGTKEKTWRNYFNGVKLPGRKCHAGIVKNVPLDPESRQAFNEGYDAARVKRRGLASYPAAKRPPAYLLPDPYAPFSGRPDNFVDQFLARAFDFANIHLKSLPLDGQAFKLGDRLARVEQCDAHLLVNLVTLARLRHLSFRELPITVSLNGIALRGANPRSLEAARTMIGGFKPPDDYPARGQFAVLTIKDEVGESHILRRGKVLERDGVDSPLTAPCATVETLDYKMLASKLEQVSAQLPVPVILFCDEVTALGVLAAMNDNGQLLYPPCTEMTIAGSLERRNLPAHALGVGWRRPHGPDADRRIDRDDGELFEHVLNGFLALEPETIAADYQTLYDTLVAHAAAALRLNAEVYVGGVRALDARDVKAKRTAYYDCLIDQSARSFARWSLRVSQRASDTWRDADTWTPVLRRARQRIIASEARRRHAIREVLRSIIRLAIGGSESDARLTGADFRTALEQQHRQLAYLVEREFDVRIPRPEEFFKARAEESFESFVSAFQHELEILSGEPDAMVLVPNLSSQETRIDPLVQGYDEMLRQAGPHTPDGLRYRARLTANALEAFGVRSLGETVGIGWMRKGDRELEMMDMYVAEHVRGSRANQLLLRHVLAYADRQGLRSVTMNMDFVPELKREWFTRMGFVEAPAQRLLRYELVLLPSDEPAQPAPALVT